MKIKSKIISISMAVGLTLALTIQSVAVGIPFTDISHVSAKDKIVALQNEGYVHGRAEGLFVPDKTITAAESIQLIVNALELNLDSVRFIKEPKATDYFQKADNDAWYADAFIIASVNGMDLPNDLEPKQEWTREDFTYYLIKTVENHRSLPMIKLIPQEIADQDQITIDYSGVIQRALYYKVTQLDAEGRFNPKVKISRAEAAEQVYNVLEYLKAHPVPNIDSKGDTIK